MANLGELFAPASGGGFMGLPRWRGEAADVVLMGAEAGTPYGRDGAYCRGGPAAIRAAAAGHAANLGHVNFDLGGPTLPAGARAADAGDLVTDEADAGANRARIGAAVTGALAAGAVPVLIGGDDSVQIPMLAAFAAARVWILQVDAHIDWRDEVEGERLGLSSTMRRASEMGHVAGMVQVGARGIGSARPGELADARARGVEFVTAAEVRREGIARAVGLIPAGAEVVICLDLDALDPAIMPAVMARTAGGLGYGDVLGLLQGVAARARIAGLGFVEFMAARDLGGIGATTAQQLLAAALGLIARQAVARRD